MSVLNDIEALDMALDAAAPDKGSWVDGRQAFIDTVANGGSSVDAFHKALDTAAPDKETWIAGRDVLVLHGKLELPAPMPLLDKALHHGRDTIKSLFKRRNHNNS